MTNNDIIRKLRYILDYGDDQMMATFASAGKEVTRSEVSDWLKKDDDEQFAAINDENLAYFLNGVINNKRGKKEGPLPVAEKKLTNNLILKKLKIAYALTDTDILDLFTLVGLNVGKAELNALFRKPGHKHYRECHDQFLRNFIYGLDKKYGPKKA
ncbi:Uncharacterized conserved protein YehS, DUF1456 family [Lishizhenia tianjinensis]|uniref:Uncharacterized conserved protein YehS, DUF1456 family n=1 Tax=Lishizhenia tianjinensis TaxID=477690 RepID=A0A1I6XTK7_9FLAO|nr:DUF1456 family protein [Lishizhenia tianjinensis]SFT41376.1 Uncharacterized conserved protein YehS, DUF1456 family [Lishizhenia tianjinensis]